MTAPITSDYLLRMAERVEQNGRDFYRLAADAVPDPTVGQVFAWLADMEDGHMKTFAAMRERLGGQAGGPAEPDEQTADYVRALLRGKFFDADADPADWFAGGESPRDLILTAVGLEKETIAFYEALRRVLAGDEDATEALDGVLREEMRHVADLSARLGEM